MVVFQDIDYINVRLALLRKLESKDYFFGHINGHTKDGVKYKLVCSILHFKREHRIVPIWWDMITYDECGNSTINEFDFKEINWF